jgi:biotin transport system substrate-specific component
MFTLQTFFVFLAGLMLPPQYAALSQAVYIAVGLLGLPLFSTGGGFSYVLAPSFGFLLGFIACAVLLSLLARKPLRAAIFQKQGRMRNAALVVLAGLAAILAMYAIGVVYMYLIKNFYMNDSKSWGDVIIAGTGVFVFIDIAKLALALPLAAAVIKRLPAFGENASALKSGVQ